MEHCYSVVEDGNDRQEQYLTPSQPPRLYSKLQCLDPPSAVATFLSPSNPSNISKVLIGWPNLIETFSDLENGGSAPQIHMEVRWRLDLDKQQQALMMLNNKSNGELHHYFHYRASGEVDSSSRSWNSPLRTDIIVFCLREPIVQNLVIKVVKPHFNGFIVVIQLSGLILNIRQVAAATKTKD